MKLYASEDEAYQWEQYPVIQLDISTAKGQDSPDNLRAKLMLLIEGKRNSKRSFGTDRPKKLCHPLPSRRAQGGQGGHKVQC